MTRNLLFLVLAIVMFVIAGFVGWGAATFTHSGALIGFGLASFAAAHLP